jgi:hypothetical protein
MSAVLKGAIATMGTLWAGTTFFTVLIYAPNSIAESFSWTSPLLAVLLGVWIIATSTTLPIELWKWAMDERAPTSKPVEGRGE